MPHRIGKAIIFLVIFFFSWTSGGLYGLFNAAYAAVKDNQKSSVHQKQEQRPEEKFQMAVEDIKAIIHDKLADNEKRGRLKAKRNEIESFDGEIRSQFAATEKKLKEAGLPAEILQRHHNFVKHYEDNLRELRTNLDAADKTKTKADFDTHLQKVKNHLEKVAPARRHKPLDPNKLPHRISDIKRKEPRTKPSEFLKDIKQTAGIFSPSDNTLEAVSFRSEARNLDFLTKDSSPRHSGIRNDKNNIIPQPSAVTPVKTGIQENQSSAVIPRLDRGIQKTDKQPILLASNGPLTGLIEKLPKYKESQNLPRPLFNNEGSEPAGNFNASSSPPFQKGDTGGFLTSTNEPIILAQAGNPPADADLAETIDVQLTPAIRAKAQELGYNPVKIYNWVRNNVEYVPTYGSIQGADMCLQTLQGNDFDIASLLIALLRASNIHARYVYGTIELPIDKVMNWVGGFTNANAAVQFIASGGTPVVGLISGGKIVAARKEHVWVEAYVKYYPLRGAAHKTGRGDTWIPLDASYKQYNYKAGMDLYNSLAFNGEQFMISYITDTQDISPYQFYGKQVITWLDNNLPDAQIEDIIGAETLPLTKVIIPQEFSYLLGTLPYRKSLAGVKFSEIPDGLRHKVNIKVIDSMFDESINYTKYLPELSGKRLTLSYEPASLDDEELVEKYGGNILAVPSYLLKVKPVIKIEGVKVAVGRSIGMGNSQALNVTFTIPHYGNDVINSNLIAGTYSAVTIQPQTTTEDNIAERMKIFRNNSQNIDAATLDDLLGELLSNIGISYFHHLKLEHDFYAKTFQMAYAKQVSAAIATLDVNIGYLVGVPYTLSQGGVKIDVRRNVHISAALSGDINRHKQFMLITGMTSSAWENMIFEAFFNTPSVSAMKLLKYANQQGVQIHTINNTNVDQIIPILQTTSEVKTDIKNAINAGKKVIIPQKELQYFEWQGTGFVVVDPSSGSGAYMINGGIAGGETAKVLKDPPVTMDKSSLEYELTKDIYLHIIKHLAYVYIGTLYVYGGKTIEGGIDCSGFTKLVMMYAGYKIPEGSYNQYNHFKNNGMLFQEPQAGDLFFFKYEETTGTYIRHTGFVFKIEGPLIKIVDASRDTGEVQERTFNTETSSYWKMRIAGYGRVIE